ncbi:MAG: hypothetical protein HOP29_01515 [Phycisphaerales bacterium]|nr:hypothetical protein [Phycisphaerales bacterium]
MDPIYQELIDQRVVLDTGGPIVYLGTLVAVTESVFVLADADIHDSRLGHATPEAYINDARQSGVSPNRRRVMVMRTAIISLSQLDDVVTE